MLKENANYKLLDIDRVGIFMLPDGAFKLWFVYYVHDKYGDGAYLCLDYIEGFTGMSRHTIIKWTRYLKAHGWLLETGKTAADMYGDKATRGSHQTKVVRVNDPFNTPGLDEMLEPLAKRMGKELSAINAPSLMSANFAPKVSSSDSCSGSSSVSVSPSSSADTASVSSTCTGQVLHVNKEGVKPSNLEPQTTTKKPLVAKDGTVMPDELRYHADNAMRIAWLAEHDPGHRVISEPRKEKTKTCKHVHACFCGSDDPYEDEDTCVECKVTFGYGDPVLCLPCRNEDGVLAKHTLSAKSASACGPLGNVRMLGE